MEIDLRYIFLKSCFPICTTSVDNACYMVSEEKCGQHKCTYYDTRLTFLLAPVGGKGPLRPPRGQRQVGGAVLPVVLDVLAVPGVQVVHRLLHLLRVGGAPQRQHQRGSQDLSLIHISEPTRR